MTIWQTCYRTWCKFRLEKYVKREPVQRARCSALKQFTELSHESYYAERWLKALEDLMATEIAIVFYEKKLDCLK